MFKDRRTAIGVRDTVHGRGDTVVAGGCGDAVHKRGASKHGGEESDFGGEEHVDGVLSS